ncbi:MAG: hypothetical protein CM15mP111_3200 [Hyphomicrobiales bacterium]|nr:MAG: hypothetical protein CM15mP111_3200 [Hyphomicrobiales bacterium]
MVRGIAQSLGIEVYPGFPASEIIYQGDRVVGVITGDFGISRNGEKKDSFMQGMEIRAKYTVFAEGARGHLTKKVIEKFQLDKESDFQNMVLDERVMEIPEEIINQV